MGLMEVYQVDKEGKGGILGRGICMGRGIEEGKGR